MSCIGGHPYNRCVSSLPSRSPRASKPTAHVGTLLREWRAARRWSQLDFALNAGVSARHLSYVETGKAQPSRNMLLRFADALDMPLQERNTLLTAAGFAPEYPEIALTALEHAGIRRAIDYILEQHEPYPAFVVDRHWNVQMANHGAERIGAFIMDGRPSAHQNIIRQVFDPDDMRAGVANWEELAGELIRHLHWAVAATPSDPVPRALLDEALAYPGVPPQWRTRDLDVPPSPLLTTVFERMAGNCVFSRPSPRSASHGMSISRTSTSNAASRWTMSRRRSAASCATLQAPCSIGLKGLSARRTASLSILP